MSGNTAEARLVCLEFAQYLGINLRTESNLLNLAEELLYKVPSGWYVGVGKCKHTRIPYFYNKETGESDWKHPLELECFHKVAQARDDLLKIEHEENKKKTELSDKEGDTLRLYRLLKRQNEQAAQMQADYSARANYLVAKHQHDLQEQNDLIARLTDTLVTKNSLITFLQGRIAELESARGDSVSDPVLYEDVSSVFSLPVQTEVVTSVSIACSKLNSGNRDGAEWVNDPVCCVAGPT